MRQVFLQVQYNNRTTISNWSAQLFAFVVEIQIGDYVLMGGEVPAMVLTEALIRLKPEVIGNSDSLTMESFSKDTDGNRSLEAPQYTRPPSFRGLDVPEVLLCGDPKKISAWQKEAALKTTAKYRPDLLEKK